MQYSTAQKLCLAGLVVGAILIGVGGLAPYWLVLNVDSLIGNVLSASMGAFLSCIEINTIVISKSGCGLISISFDADQMGWFLYVRIAAAFCILVGGLCGMFALCVACCACCRRLIALGIMAILAAAAGIFSAVVFAQKTEIFTTTILNVKITDYGWAFYVFCVGVGLQGIMSFVACFATPENNNAVGGMVLGQNQVQQPPTQMSVVSTQAPGGYPNAVYGPPGQAPPVMQPTTQMYVAKPSAPDNHPNAVV